MTYTFGGNNQIITGDVMTDWATHTRTLTRRMKNMEISQIINDAILEWYSDQGQEVPQWKMQKDPQWWIDYLMDLKEND